VSGPSAESYASLIACVRAEFLGSVIGRGDKYAREGRVELLKCGPYEVAARVTGTMRYAVTLLADPASRNNELFVSCTCAAFERDLCKHLWAVLVITDRDEPFRELASSRRPVIVSPMDEAAAMRPPARAPARVRPVKAPGIWREALRAAVARPLARLSPPATLDRRHRVEIGYLLDLPASRVRDCLELVVRQRAVGASAAPGPWKPAQLAPRALDAIEDARDVAILRLALPRPDALDRMLGDRFVTPSTISLDDPELWERFLRPLAETGRCTVLLAAKEPPVPLRLDERGAYRLVLVVREERARVSVHGELRRGAHAIALTDLTLLLEQGAAFVEGRALAVESDAAVGWVRVLRREGRLLVDAAETEDLLRGLVTTCGIASLDLPPAFPIDDAPPSFVTRIALSSPREPWRMNRGPLQATVTFDYGGTLVGWREPGELACAFEARRLFPRDLPGERDALEQLAAVGFRLSGGAGQEGLLELATSRLAEAVGALPAERFEVRADGVRYRKAARTAFSVESDIDWFELSAIVEIDGVAVPYPEVLAAARAANGTVRLGDGSVGIVPAEWLARLKRVAAMSQDPTALRFTRAQLGLLDALLADDREPVAWGPSLDALRTQLANTTRLVGAKTPRAFRGKLRPYQAQGVAWLAWLEGIGVSGCLADDMGLGKTVQVLAHLVSRKARGEQRGPSLVVAPRSVVYNWLDEAARFAPSLKVAELAAGAKLDEPDVVVTTYGILRQEIANLTKTTFDYAILDEAHAIKNPNAATTAAAGLLRARHRLALTGTPVENHLGELASLFDFLNPGMLGPRTRDVTRSGFGKLEAETAQQLGRGLKPFLLRRTKSDVLPDLPARVEQTLHCEMTKPQRVAYDRVRRHYQDTLLGRIRRDGVARSTMHVLEALLRLRQLACHTALVDPARAGDGSGKLDVLIEKLVPLAEQGKKALVFSQFTSFLDLVEAELGDRGVTFERLDGATTNRKTHVARFQEDPACPVFLVSLKAGGLGLNLTAAEYVFLLDPWWNPAAEAQAIDRAHRIGQTRTVVAYRMLATDSIEHRVAELQAKKRELVAAVFNETGGAPLKGLSIADVEMLLA
jgi:superfamily II DNA or RNA helicase